MPYMTPTSIPTETVCFLVKVPDDQNLKSAFFGALLDLTLDYNWEQSEGGLTPQQTVNFTIDWYQEIMESMCMGICDDIIAGCLTNQTFLEAMAVALVPPLGEQGLCPSCGTGVPAVGVDDTVLQDNGTGCNQAVLFGQCMRLVEIMHETFQDFAQGIQAGISITEIILELVKVSPIVREVSQTALNTFADWFQGVIDVYEAAYDLTTQVDIACELYCLVQANCKITLGDARTAYVNTLSFGGYNPTSSLEDFFNWIIGLATNTDLLIVSSMHLIVMEIWARGAKWLDSPLLILQYALDTSAPISPSSCSCDPVVIVPVLSSTPCYGGGGFIGTIENIGGNKWRLHGANGSGADKRVSFKDEEDRPFQITSMTWNVNPVKSVGFINGGAGCFINSDGSSMPLNTSLQEAGATWQITAADRYIDVTLESI